MEEKMQLKRLFLMGEWRFLTSEMGILDFIKNPISIPLTSSPKPHYTPSHLQEWEKGIIIPQLEVLMLPSRKLPLDFLFLGLISLLILSSCIAPQETETMSYAGLLVQYEDGSETTMCIEFEGLEITGEDLLDLSGIPYVSDVTNPMGSKVCSIDGEGCEFPAEKCFCQCGNLGPCTYWAYFALSKQGAWVYAPIGAQGRKVRHGDVDAWAWLSKASKDVETVEPTLPIVTFEEICPGK
jgi:hypothetical protein